MTDMLLKVSHNIHTVAAGELIVHMSPNFFNLFAFTFYNSNVSYSICTM